MPWKTLSEQLAQSDIIDEFDLEESRAFADLAVLVMLADERVTNQELEELTAQLEALPFEDAQEVEEKLADHLAYARQTVEQMLGDEEAVSQFIDETTSRIEGEERREHVFELLSAMAYTDGVDMAEEDVCYRIGRAFGFDDERIEQALVGGSIDSMVE